jgi:thioesterase domain-containing protein
MARQLRAAGKGVDAIMLFDSFCPLDADPGLAWRLRTHLEALQSEGAVYARRRLMARLKRERQWLEQRFFHRKQVTATQSRSMFETAAANWQAIEARYRPLPFHASAYLFRVDSHDPDDAKYFAERYGGWSRLLTMGVQSFVVPGTHVSMCEEPNVQVLAEKLRAVLDELDSTSRAAQ